MKKFLKLSLSVLLTAALITGIAPVSFAQPEAQVARLYNIYGDGMLFKQNDTVTLNGIAPGGTEVSCVLTDDSGTAILKARATANRSNEFTLTFTAPAGGYKEYTVTLFNDGKEFQTLNNVVFGEVWLASGQSNMEYALIGEIEGAEFFNSGRQFSKWLRAFLIQGITPYKGSPDIIPVDPQKEIENGKWVNGTEPGFYAVSAVAYYFAQQLMDKLDMPIGIINASLGGSSIAAWLSREAIDSDAAVKADFSEAGEYIEYSSWNEAKQSRYYDMTTCYNLKINAIRAFKLSGMIWYQGETDATFLWKHGRYSRAFDLLQRSYTEYFNYENGMLPIIFSSLCSYKYSPKADMLDMNYEFTEIQQARPESRALISVYDIPLDYTKQMGAIHPGYKQPIGNRMAHSALGFVYGSYDTYTTATVKGTEIKDGCVFVTLRNTGSGLNFRGSKLNGFSICGADGVYAQAEAKLVSEDTVCIYSELVAEPVSAAYAYTLSNQNCNLCATQGKSTFIPVAPFVTDPKVSTRYLKYTEWTDCENDEAWRITVQNDMIGMYNTWNADNAEISFDAESAFSGINGMNITSDSKKFSISPRFSYRNGNKERMFNDVETNFDDYGKLSFKIRNNGSSDINLQSLRIYVNDVSYYSPVLEDSKDISCTIPADGEWHTLTYDLNRLYLTGNEGGIAYTNNRLDTVRSIKLCFKNKAGGTADISVDEFRFTPDSTKHKAMFDPVFKNLDNPLEFISAVFVSAIGLIVRIFR